MATVYILRIDTYIGFIHPRCCRMKRPSTVSLSTPMNSMNLSVACSFSPHIGGVFSLAAVRGKRKHQLSILHVEMCCFMMADRFHI